MQSALLTHFATLLIFMGVLTTEFSHALRDVRVKVPQAVRRGERAHLKCHYDIEDDSLYAVKWYKGRREFYSYTPSEQPPMKVFHFPGVRVERHASNASQVTLDAVSMSTAGKYSCEVSADAPSFHTLIASGDLEVVDVPHSAPVISGIRSRYRLDDILRGNCTSRHSRPAANLTWTINNEEINPAHVRHYKVMRDPRTDMETAVLGIHFRITTKHFLDGKLKLRCIGQVHNIYWKAAERTIAHVDHLPKHVPKSANGLQHHPKERPAHPASPPYDHYAPQDSELQSHANNENNYWILLQDFLFRLLPLGTRREQQEADTSGGDDAQWHAAWGFSSAATAHRSTTPTWIICLLLASLAFSLTDGRLATSAAAATGRRHVASTQRNIIAKRGCHCRCRCPCPCSSPSPCGSPSASGCQHQSQLLLHANGQRLWGGGGGCGEANHRCRGSKERPAA